MTLRWFVARTVAGTKDGFQVSKDGDPKQSKDPWMVFRKGDYTEGEMAIPNDIIQEAKYNS